MAEGGEEIPMGTFPGSTNDGYDDKETDNLIPHEEGDKGSGARRKAKFYARPEDVPGYKGTSTSKQDETTFIDSTPSGKIIFGNKQKMREILNENIHIVFPNIENSMLPKIRHGPDGQLIFNDGGKRNRDWVIAIYDSPSHNIDSPNFPSKFRKLLGKTNVQINNENHEKQLKEEEKQAKKEQKLEQDREAKARNDEKLRDAEERLENLRRVEKDQEEARKNALTTEDEESYTRRIETTRNAIRQVSNQVDEYQVEGDRLEGEEKNADENVQQGVRQVEAARERVDQRLLSLRDRVKEIFKKHGFTVVAVVSAIGVVIGVIVSNLKAGLTKVAKGVGNGLKELGKKLGEILPGMVGAIASFIFKTAGQVIGFLAEHAWLLIVGLVVLAVEQFKKKTK